jgi:predicted nucleic acid-binding protein
MPFVLDASVALVWALPDEDHPLAALALELLHSDEALVPSLWWYEVRNSLIANERRHRLKETDTAIFLRMLSQLPISVDRMPDEAQVLAICRRRKLTIYDSVYLELAQREALPLATLDRELGKAARAERVRQIDKALK